MRNWRVNLVFIFFLLFSAAIVGRLIFIQILQTDFYKALSQGLQNFPSQILPERGEIFLVNGEPLAKNKNFSLVFAVPPKVIDSEKTAETLSEILHLDKKFILEKLKVDSLYSFYSLIKNKLTQEEAELIKNSKLAGIYLDEERLRYYPQETLASQVIGFLDKNNQGQYGLEEYYDEILKGESKGRDLFLTIDYNIQFRAEKLLERAKENLDIEGGQIIVIDPNSGRIIAFSHFPNFNPNSYQEYALEGLGIFKNRITQDFFEPGSVFKPITFAAALNEEKITPQTTYIDKGQVKIDGWPKPIYNYDERVHGEQTMTNVLEKSINTGAVFVEKLLPHYIFLNYIEKFGIFERTGIDLRESFSENKEFKQGYEINFATASFGQGIEMTAIQLARAYCAIANGGKLITPYLVVEKESKISEPIISSKTSSQLTAMLVSVVENGFAKRAKIPGYYIAGKTGTAQISFSALGINKKGYSEKTWQTFVGFFPAFSPQFLILVKLDKPKTKTAEYSAVPIFHDLAEYIIHYYQIPPDYELD